MNQNYEVHCGRCNWWGYDRQLVTAYVAHPNCPDDVVSELGCPACLSSEWLEYEDNGSMARLELSASYRNKCRAKALELLHCLTSQ